MKTIGLLCGLSWVSTQIYYESINRKVLNTLKGSSSAPMILNSLNGDCVARLIKNRDFEGVSSLLTKECIKLEEAGCDFIGICCNTLHHFYEPIQKKLRIPIVHIMDSVVDKLKQSKAKTVGILGTEYTIKNRLYDSYLESAKIKAVYPSDLESKMLDNIIFNICSGRYFPVDSKEQIENIINNLISNGADIIVLGCTELGVAIKQNNNYKIIDSAIIHADALVHKAMEFITDSEVCSSPYLTSSDTDDFSHVHNHQ